MTAQLLFFIKKLSEKFSIRTNESTSVSNKTCLIIYIRVPYEGEIYYFHLVDLESCTGAAICDVLLKGIVAPRLPEVEEKESTRPRRCHTSLSEILCWTSWPPSSHRSSTDHWSCAKSPHFSNAPPSSPSQRNRKLLDLMTTGLWL